MSLSLNSTLEEYLPRNNSRYLILFFSFCSWIYWRLVFTSDRVRVGVVVRFVRRPLTYDLVRMENPTSRKRSHKLDGIEVGRIRTFPFLPIPFTTPSLMIQWKRSVGDGSKSGRTNQSQCPEPNIVIALFFRFCLRLRQCSFHFIIKRRSHKQNQCSASDSVGVIFIRSYRSTLLITTPTATPSLVKTSL